MFRIVVHQKAKLVTYVVIIFVLMLAFFGGINIYNSCKIINNQSNANLIFLTDGIRKSTDRYLTSAQEEVEHCKYIIELTVNKDNNRVLSSEKHIYSQKQVISIQKYLADDVSKILLYSTKHVQGLSSIYFDMDNNLFNSKNLFGIWYVKTENGFKIIDNGAVSSMLPETRSDLKWYYLPKKLKKGIWSEPYIDDDLKIKMITYSTPIYVKNRFLGVAGVDISLNALETFLKNFKIYDNGKIYILDNNYQIIFAEGYATNALTDTINNNLHNFLSDKNSTLQIYNKYPTLIKSHGKVFAICSLYNGFILVIEVPTEELYGELNKLITFTSLSLILTILISILIAIEAYAKIKKINNELSHKEKLISMGTMAAEVAHEINNPLGYISCNIDTLKKFFDKIKKLLITYENAFRNIHSGQSSAKDEIEKIEEYKINSKMEFVLDSVDEIIDETKGGINRVSKTVLNLKNFSKDDSHDGKTNENLSDIINEALNILSNKLDSSVEIIKRFDDAPLLYCNKNQLKQVLVNMIENANHALLEKNQPDKKIVIYAGKKGQFAHIEVEDNGAGIKIKKINKIFDAFFTTKEPGKGTGLGLSIAQDIVVNKHNGDILVESKKGNGTKFIIKIPYQKNRGNDD